MAAVKTNGTWRILDDRGKVIRDSGSGLREARAKFVQKRQEKLSSSAYRGAESGRAWGTWGSIDHSAQGAFHNRRRFLVNRSQDLIRNDPIAHGMLRTYESEVIGTGIRVQADVNAEQLGLSEVEAEELNADIDRRWKQWIRWADYEERTNFYDIQALTFRQWRGSGETIVLPRWVERDGAPLDFCLQVLDQDRVRQPYGHPESTTLRDGVELGPRGEEVAVHVLRHHPGDRTIGSMGMESDRIPRRGRDGEPVYWRHYDVLRPGQLRGEPFLSSCLNYFAHLDQYLEAEWWAKQLEALFGVFIKSDDPVGQAEGALNSDLTSRYNQPIDEIGVGTVNYLGEGEDVVSVSSNRPGSGSVDFVNMALRFIGASQGWPIELVLKDFSRSNFSNVRAALIGARRLFRQDQLKLIAHVIEPARREVIRELWLRDVFPRRLTRDPRNFEALAQAQYLPPGWQWVDPQKDATAAETKLTNHLDTFQNLYAERGEDWRVQLYQRAKEERLRTELGLAPAAAGGGAGDDPDEVEEDERRNRE